jgi:bacterioferritin-associated ferredoxin
MFVCICNAIRESELRNAACGNLGDAEAIYAKLGKRPNCGQCLDQANAIIDETRELSLEPAE